MAEMLETIAARQGRYKDEDVRQALFSRNHGLQALPELVRLLTAERVFPKVVDILGPNISLFHAFSPCTKPAADTTSPPTDFDRIPQFGFHRDAGLHPNRDGRGFEFPERPSSRMTVKAIFYLSDCSRGFEGNTWVCPGSHLRGSPGDGTESAREVDGFGGLSAQEQTAGGVALGQPAGAIPVRCPPGSALIFDRRLLHAATPNWASHERLLCILGWGPRWIRPVDGMFVETAMHAARCPIVRQLLGESTSAAGLYLPTAEDAPLRRWLVENSFENRGGVGYDNLLADPRAVAAGWVDRGLVTPSEGQKWRWQLDGDGPATTLPRHPQRGASGRLLRNPSYRSSGDEKPAPENSGVHVDQPFSYEEAAAQIRAVVDAVGLDAADWRMSLLSGSARARFDRDGWIVLGGSSAGAPASEVAALRELLDDVGSRVAAGFSAANSYSTSPALLGLLTNSAILSPVTQLLDSTNIAATHAILFGTGSTAAADLEVSARNSACSHSSSSSSSSSSSAST